MKAKKYVHICIYKIWPLGNCGTFIRGVHAGILTVLLSKVGTGYDDFRPHHQHWSRQTNMPFVLVQILTQMFKRKGTGRLIIPKRALWYGGWETTYRTDEIYHEGSTRSILYSSYPTLQTTVILICYEQLTVDQRHCRFQQASDTSMLYTYGHDETPRCKRKLAVVEDLLMRSAKVRTDSEITNIPMAKPYPLEMKGCKFIITRNNGYGVTYIHAIV